MSFAKYSIYGTILQDGVFRILNYLDSLDDGLDKRIYKRGMDPKSFNKYIRIKIAIHERIYPNKNLKI